jgi:hypothetical protein
MIKNIKVTRPRSRKLNQFRRWNKKMSSLNKFGTVHFKLIMI